ncbi:SDR family oxidoreductase [Halanaeroarchaeum sulfurireducens]|uniref:3-oxoacyl-(Acyl-carrier-protein) reductase n=1 Tax=Halanaeroarchaeum sulfurireducens TaxID=1604004 RepID=A0A0N7FU02_9EURY|nr:SDR family oxidoreductase [Halanaeroarchaeum sulfurireducens]ALG82991.1 3-oxoacyl-(acyl-carrier-protein) reductase [Halanaeroarchaeum sulfurireducens]
MDLQLDGNAALVTASSSGLGKASAKALAREGADVVINGRDEKRLAEARDEVAAVAAGEVVAQPADLTDAAAVEALVERTVEAFGGLDHLVTSAGGPPSGAFLDTDDDDWYAAFDLLVMSVVRLARAAEPHLREGEGTIVNIPSRSVKEALDSLVLSNSVRMSVIGLEKTLSQEFAPEIRANAVLPGPHETARIRELVEAAVERGEVDSYEAGLDDWANNPLDRIGDPMELGDVVAFLSSPASGFVNGAAIPVDGGATGSNL